MKKAIIMSMVLMLISGMCVFAADKSVTKTAPAVKKAGVAPKKFSPEMKAQIEKAKAQMAQAKQQAKEQIKAQREMQLKQDAQLQELIQSYRAAKPRSEEKESLKKQISTLLIERRKKQLDGQTIDLKDLKERLNLAEKQIEEQKQDKMLDQWANDALERLVQNNEDIQLVFSSEKTFIDQALEPYNKQQRYLFLEQQARMKGANKQK